MKKVTDITSLWADTTEFESLDPRPRKGIDKAAKELKAPRGFLNLCTILAEDEKPLLQSNQHS